MTRERLLLLLGYDEALLRQLSAAQRQSLRGAGAAWLLACLVLGAAAAYAAYLVQSSRLAAAIVGPACALLTVNLLRVVNAGGGSSLRTTLSESETACEHYRPSLVPALVLGVLALLLAQPAQIVFWPALDDHVEEHRQELIAQHTIAARELGSDPSYYGDELAVAGFPIFRLQLIWQEPRRALRLTALLCLFILIPTFWSQLISIRAVRAYEKLRCRRRHTLQATLDRAIELQVDELLAPWRAGSRA